ncbi:MAG: ABC transporter ATP-binding protein [Bacteroidia bacterium]|nr:ABC transporter ATP-binding protein [Bacteroidia bacterium]MDG2042108.1 ABC transporter ATP-binding protein [Bacteroidia bacterium]|tara:strand:+ start:34575 stop:36335 length:1761 start_codon:yes stop_codon:yes gene_type:complete
MSSKSNNSISFDFHLILRIIKLAKPHQTIALLALVLTVIATILAPVRPLLVQYTLDQPIANKDIEGITTFSIFIFVHLLLNSIVIFGNTYVSNLLGQKVIEDLRIRVYKHIISMSSRFFDRSKVGTLVTRSISDVETISSFFSQGFISILGDLAQIIVVLGVMLYSSWQLTLISLCVLPLLIVASDFFRRGVRVSFQTVRTKVSQMNSFVQEQIVGMEVVQIFGKQNQEFDKFEKINREHREANKRSIFYYAIYFPIVEILSSLALGLIIFWSVGYPSEASVGLISAFILYINLIFRPIRFIADRFNTMQMGMVSSERIFDLLDDFSDVEKKGKQLLTDVNGGIDFKNVWFSYNEDVQVLKDVSFRIEPGRSLAIVGATGAGKSSIVNLITRLYEFQKGDILIDGVNLKTLDLKSLRSQIGVVMQDVFLFAGTVNENVNLKNKEISSKQVEDAAKAVGAYEFIQKLEGNFNYEVMERGVSLSGGQRQLVSFIRAMVADPKILILDEATSSVDSETEDLIQQAIKKLMSNRTSIVIAHRLSTIKEADSILVLDKGVVVEIGDHKELMAKKGAYFTLFQKQFQLIEST